MTDNTYETESLHTPESRDRDARLVGADGAAPTGPNADEWALFLSEWGTAYCAVRIAEAIEAAEQRGYARGIEAAVEKMRRLSGKLDILACEDVLQIADDLSAISPTPPAPVTVQEAARALLDQTPKALDAGIEALKAAADDGHGADVCLAHVLRALAEQEAPSTPPRDGVE